MRTLMTALLAGVALCSAAAPASAKHGEKLGKGDYYSLIFPEEDVAKLFPDAAPKDIRPVTTRDFDVQQVLDGSCREQVPQQAPGMLKDVGIYTIRTAPLSFVGGGLAAKLGGFAPKGSYVTNVDYGINAGVQTVFGAIGAGLNAHEMGKHTDIAGCMAGFVNRAQNAGYLNRNIIIVYNVHPARGHPIRRSSFADPIPGDTKPAAATNSSEQTARPPNG